LKNEDGSSKWSTVQVNAIPIGGSAINVVFGTCDNSWRLNFGTNLPGVVWIWALLSDFLRTRWTLIVTQGI
jgi:hypothetical protein